MPDGFRVTNKPKVSTPEIQTDRSISFIGGGGGRGGKKPSYDAFNKILQAIADARGDAQNRASLTPEDLFGESITRSTNSIRSNANATKMALGRANAAKGEDVTGGFSVVMDDIDEGANEAISGVEQTYADRTVGANERSLTRGDQLLSMLLGGEGSKLGIMNSNFWQGKQLDLARQQANRQLVLDLIGTATNIAGSPFGSPFGGNTGE